MTAGGQRPDRQRVCEALADLAATRGTDATFCPSEAARALARDWRPLMPLVREVAAEMQAAGDLAAFKSGAPVDLAAARGPVRLGAPRR